MISKDRTIYITRIELNVPEEIIQSPNWVLWRYEVSRKSGRKTKVPYQPTGSRAAVNEPSTWSTFDEAAEVFQQGSFDGVGWCVPLDGETRYWGFDYDDAIDPETGDFNEWRPGGELAPVQPKDVFHDLNTYTERTPSGAGFRAYVKCSVNVPGRNKKEYGERNPKTEKIPGMEIYSTGRFFTFTGDQLPGSPNTIEERTTEALALHSRVFPAKPAATATQTSRARKLSQRIDVQSEAKIDQLACDLADGHIGPRHHLLMAVIGTVIKLNWERDKIAALLNALIYLLSQDDPAYELDVMVPKYLRSVDKCFERKSRQEIIPGWNHLRESLTQTAYDQIYASLVKYSLDDVGNGRRLVDKSRDSIRYCADDKSWYMWDGVRWNNNELAIAELAKGIASDIRAEANALEPPAKTGNKDADEEAFKKFKLEQGVILRWANSSGNATHLAATIKCASSDSRVRCQRSEFDSHHDLLNCPNGIINLRDGTLLPHDRNLMLSYLCPTEFHPAARHPIFEESLAAFTRNHSDLPPFLQTFFGYTLQGNKSEERIVILHGKGNAGKGTLMDWIGNMLGSDYCCRMDYNSVRKQDRNAASASGDIARLEGKRVVIVSEFEKGCRLAESFMKSASGNDGIVARVMWKGEREFVPTHQFIFQTNYRPGFDSMDSGNIRRYLEIPFDNDLSKDPKVKFDGNIKLAMRQDKAFLQAVLAWAVAGAVDWYKHGLRVPESVETATKALFRQNDFLSRFFEDCCVKDPSGKVSLSELTFVYGYWCSQQGEDPAKKRTFNHMIEERGFEQRVVKLNGKATRMWLGVSLRSEVKKVGGGTSTSGVYYRGSIQQPPCAAIDTFHSEARTND